ncbi:hypothetical protein ACH4SP_36745 [Streptomyces sp. NPDC021093]|uniref:hypothetical protein n=1 Tax=Streptomyces sp. NPDC021093 TaxID=3365112 RepID=UPI0037A3448D
MRMKKLAAVAAGSALAVGGLFATGSTASAGAAPSEIGVSADCWTTFNPGNPQGGPFTHTYRNCNPKAISVATGYRKDGQTVRVNSCRYVAAGATTSWRHSSSVKGAQYETHICRYPA